MPSKSCRFCREPARFQARLPIGPGSAQEWTPVCVSHRDEWQSRGWGDWLVIPEDAPSTQCDWPGCKETEHLMLYITYAQREGRISFFCGEHHRMTLALVNRAIAAEVLARVGITSRARPESDIDQAEWTATQKALEGLKL